MIMLPRHLYLFLIVFPSYTQGFVVSGWFKALHYRPQVVDTADSTSSCRRVPSLVELSSSSSSSSSVDEEGSKLRSNRPFAMPMPENLKRKLSVQRPMLGHVVPKYARENMKKQQQQQQQQQQQISGGSENPRLRPQGETSELNNPSMLKISAGTAKGRRLDSPQVYLRPMMGKVREAVFSTLTSFGLYDSSVAVRHLDIFAGSGSVGLESLSRGATHATFVDLAQTCCDCIERNLALCRFVGGNKNDENNHDKKATVICNDAVQLLRDPYKCGIPVGQTFQIVTMCPPYEEVIYADLLEGVANCPCVTEDTIVLIEYPIELGSLPHVVRRTDGGAMIGIRNRKYGRTVIAMYIVNPTGKLSSANSRPEEFVSLR